MKKQLLTKKNRRLGEAKNSTKSQTTPVFWWKHWHKTRLRGWKWLAFFESKDSHSGVKQPLWSTNDLLILVISFYFTQVMRSHKAIYQFIPWCIWSFTTGMFPHTHTIHGDEQQYIHLTLVGFNGKYGFHVGFPKTKKSLKSDECVMEKMKSDWLFHTQLKNMLVKLDPFPRDRGENKKCLSCHHLEIIQVAKASEVELSGFTGWDVSSFSISFSCDAMASCDGPKGTGE